MGASTYLCKVAMGDISVKSRSVHRQQSLNCGICNRVYRSKKVLFRHLHKHEHPMVFSCSECNKTFPSKTRLNVHSRVHSGERPFKCSYCQLDFPSRFQLKLHVRRHTGEKPYSCSYCKKEFSSASGLRQHVKTHTNESPFSCSQCSRRFKQKEKLKQHEHIHTGVRPFMCDQCPHTFRIKHALIRHLRIHSGDTFKCGLCSTGFGELYALKKHHKNKHDKIPFTGPSDMLQSEDQTKTCTVPDSDSSNLNKSDIKVKTRRHKVRVTMIKQRKQQIKRHVSASIHKLEECTSHSSLGTNVVKKLYLAIDQRDTLVLDEDNGWHRIPLPAASDLLNRNIETIPKYHNGVLKKTAGAGNYRTQHNGGMNETAADGNNRTHHNGDFKEIAGDGNRIQHSGALKETTGDSNNRTQHSGGVKAATTDGNNRTQQNGDLKKTAGDRNNIIQHNGDLKKAAGDGNKRTQHNIDMKEATVDENNRTQHNETCVHLDTQCVINQGIRSSGKPEKSSEQKYNLTSSGSSEITTTIFHLKVSDEVCKQKNENVVVAGSHGCRQTQQIPDVGRRREKTHSSTIEYFPITDQRFRPLCAEERENLQYFKNSEPESASTSYTQKLTYVPLDSQLQEPYFDRDSHKDSSVFCERFSPKPDYQQPGHERQPLPPATHYHQSFCQPQFPNFSENMQLKQNQHHHHKATLHHRPEPSQQNYIPYQPHYFHIQQQNYDNTPVMEDNHQFSQDSSWPPHQFSDHNTATFSSSAHLLQHELQNYHQASSAVLPVPQALFTASLPSSSVEHESLSRTSSTLSSMLPFRQSLGIKSNQPLLPQCESIISNQFLHQPEFLQSDQLFIHQNELVQSSQLLLQQQTSVKSNQPLVGQHESVKSNQQEPLFSNFNLSSRSADMSSHHSQMSTGTAQGMQATGTCSRSRSSVIHHKPSLSLPTDHHVDARCDDAWPVYSDIQHPYPSLHHDLNQSFTSQVTNIPLLPSLDEVHADICNDSQHPRGICDTDVTPSLNLSKRMTCTDVPRYNIPADHYFNGGSVQVSLSSADDTTMGNNLFTPKLNLPAYIPHLQQPNLQLKDCLHMQPATTTEYVNNVRDEDLSTINTWPDQLSQTSGRPEHARWHKQGVKLPGKRESQDSEKFSSNSCSKSELFHRFVVEIDPVSSVVTDPVRSVVTVTSGVTEIDPVSSVVTEMDPVSSVVTDPVSSFVTDPVSSIVTDPVSSVVTDPVSSVVTVPVSSVVTDSVSWVVTVTSEVTQGQEQNNYDVSDDENNADNVEEIKESFGDGQDGGRRKQTQGGLVIAGIDQDLQQDMKLTGNSQSMLVIRNEPGTDDSFSKYRNTSNKVMSDCRKMRSQNKNNLVELKSSSLSCMGISDKENSLEASSHDTSQKLFVSEISHTIKKRMNQISEINVTNMSKDVSSIVPLESVHRDLLFCDSRKEKTTTVRRNKMKSSHGHSRKTLDIKAVDLVNCGKEMLSSGRDESSSQSSTLAVRKAEFITRNCAINQENNIRQCLLCGKKYKETSHLRHHVVTRHFDELKHECPTCNKQFPNKSRLQRHVHTHVAQKPYPCRLCPRAFTAKKYLDSHLSWHDKQPPIFACADCGKTFPRRYQLKIHNRTHSGEKPYKCSQCSSHFATSYQVRLHERIHSDILPYQCCYCAQRFRSNTNLAVHVKRHVSDRPYLCATCGAAFYEASKLTAHIRVHTGVHPFMCDQCPRTFKVKHLLIRHLRWHSGDTFKCHHCNKQFDEKWILRAHIQKHHSPV